ncbi:MAG: response regulator [Candidatus Moranbacteria bacterium]|nr:response regulator [Candidatus Moranbacteria bacterium]
MAKTGKILIVDDEKPLARALELKLKHAGFEAKSVLDGREAIELLEKENFDLMLLDLVMPNLDGFGVLNEINSKGIKVRVIVVSNLSQKEDSEKSKELGAIDYFVKSDVPISDIVERVKRTMANV